MPDASAEAAEPAPQRGAIADRSLERAPPAGDQVIARIALARRICRRSRAARSPRPAPRCAISSSGQSRAARQLLDRAAVEIARREIHRGEVAAGAQRVVDQADALEQLRPVDVGDQPHAGDDVAHGDVRSRPAAAARRARSASAVVPCAASRSSSHVSAGVTCGSWSRSRCTSCTANAVGSGALLVVARSSGARLGRLAVRRPAAGRPARRPPGARRGCSTMRCGRAPQILDQHDAQRDRDRPQLADRQRLHALVGAHEAAQHLGIEAAVGVRDERPGQAEHARIAGERARPPASAAAGSSRAAGRRGSRGSALRRGGSCRAATRPPA